MQELTKLGITEILNDWNYWKRDFEAYVPRTEYLNTIRRFRKSGEIIVLTGIRRSGKSTLLKLEMQDLAQHVGKEALLYINFEDPRFGDTIDTRTLDMIFETYRETINPDGDVFIFLDEVQNVNGWEKWVRTAYELQKAKVYVTGSSSRLLSGEIATSISGRYLQLAVYPLTFSEFLAFQNVECKNIMDYSAKKIEIHRLFAEYLRYGGFPRVASIDEDLKKEELVSYYNTILLKDILSRFRLRNFEKLKKLARYLLTNDTKQNSINSITRALKYNYQTVEDYIDYLRQVYMVFELRNFSYSLKKQLISDTKYYAIDTGFVNAVSFSFSQNIGRLYENVVFNELMRRGKTTFFLNEGGSECDFIVQEGNAITGAYQVCYDLNEQNLQRETSGLVMACKTFGLTRGSIITESTIKTTVEDGVEIRIVPITVFLLGLAEEV
ncbi:ATP-binding protein [Methanogenium organophilum]|uniref:ATP-binding protein n=1 Tax=Methanogenium organophilum TaxID=2199 RepID=A0A9X9T7U5_METOG|nr:ATP-binding protein [Methanogenium organophilum]WAI00462.1 ATP-binding protein [Methanogenium organophilum]